MTLRLRLGSILHRVASAALAGGLAGGISGGLGGRLAMRVTALMATEREQGILTEAEETVGQITLDGTLGLVVFGGILVGVLGGLIHAATSRWFADAGPWRGLAFGAFLLGALGWAVIEGDNFDFTTLGSVTVNVAMFAAIYLLFGVIIAPLDTLIGNALKHPSFSVGGVLSLPFYAIGLLFAVMILPLTGTGFGEDGRELPFYALIPLWLLVCATLTVALIGRGGRRFERLSDLRADTRAMAAALAVVAVPLAVVPDP
jgi:hypothetical protein